MGLFKLWLYLKGVNQTFSKCIYKKIIYNQKWKGVDLARPKLDGQNELRIKIRPSDYAAGLHLGAQLRFDFVTGSFWQLQSGMEAVFFFKDSIFFFLEILSSFHAKSVFFCWPQSGELPCYEDSTEQFSPFFSDTNQINPKIV